MMDSGSEEAKHRVRRTIRVVGVVLLIALSGVVAGTFSRNVRAGGTFTGLNGYAGNNAVYLTTGVTGSYVIGTSSKLVDNVDASGGNVHNTISLVIGQDAKTPSSGPVMYEQFAPNGGLIDGGPVLNIWIPIAAAGAETFNNGWNVFEEELFATLANSPNVDSTVNFVTSTNTGINVTGPQWGGKTLNQYLSQLGIDALGFLPGVGWVFGAYSTANDALSGIAGSSVPGVNSQGTANEIFEVYGGCIPTGLLCRYDENVYTAQSEVIVQIPESEFLSGPTITITAENLLSTTSCITCSYNTGAIDAIALGTNPAVTLTGTVYLFGQPDANALVNLEATTGTWAGYTYQLKTNSAGQYAFYAQPGVSYTLFDSVGTSIGTASGSVSKTMPASATTSTLDLTIASTKVTGRVTDSSSGAGVSGADVEVQLNGIDYNFYANSQGYYTFTTNQAGTYYFMVSAIYYDVYGWVSYSIPINTVYPLNFQLVYNGGGGVGGGGCRPAPFGPTPMVPIPC